jgi:HSP20 family molecular chaperone IbpA
MNRRNRKKNPNDIFGIEELLDAWMDMMAVIPQIDARATPKTALFGKPKHEGTMSYEERDKDIVFTIDMPGVAKKDIDIKVEPNSISVKAENGGKRKYNYSRKFKPSVDVDSAKATFKNGVLDISIKKTEVKDTGKSIKIQ